MTRCTDYPVTLLRLIAGRMRQRLLVIEHHRDRACRTGRRTLHISKNDRCRSKAGHRLLLADDFSARDRRRHARNLGQAFLASPWTP